MVQAWSMGSAPRMGWSKSDSNFSPGPSAYRPNSAVAVKKAPGWGFGTGKRDKKWRGSSPGPGAYSGNAKSKQRKDPEYTFGMKPKSQFGYLNQGPGPGAYSLNDMKDKVGWSFGGRNKQGWTDKVPGPGTYSTVDNAWSRKGGNAFGRESQRKTGKVNGVPGPG